MEERFRLISPENNQIFVAFMFNPGVSRAVDGGEAAEI